MNYLIESTLLLCTTLWANAGACTNGYQPIECTAMTQGERDFIVSYHNEKRQTVAQGKAVGLPKAKNMPDLDWNEELGSTAKEHADKCVFAHEIPQIGSFSSMGQNLYMTMSSAENTNSDWKGAIDSWYNEVSEFDPKDIEPFVFSGKTGHFTQLAWAGTTAVGCSRSCFKAGGEMPYQQLYTCNYGPAGNVIGGQMYEKE